MLQDGLRRRLPTAPDEEIEDPATYGIDWDAAGNPTLMCHLLEHNPQEWEHHNLFAASLATLSHVPCEAPNCPMTAEQLITFDDQLVRRIPWHARNMLERRNVWTIALELARLILEGAL